MQKSFIVLLLMIPSLACSLLSTPQATELATQPVATLAATNTEASSFIVTGTYATQTYENGAVCILEIKGEPDLKFYINCNRGAPAYNQGTLSGEFELTDTNIGTFKSDQFGPCELLFEFDASGVQVTQTGADFECGFGAGVTATGIYTYQNQETPDIP